MATLQEKFGASMASLEPGDVLSRNRDGLCTHSLVLRRDRKTQALILTRFSEQMSIEPHPREVCLNDGWLTDESGAILLLPEEWDCTEKGAGKALLCRDMTKAKGKAEEIFSSLSDRNKGLLASAEDLLGAIGVACPTREQVELVALALSCAAKQVWR